MFHIKRKYQTQVSKIKRNFTPWLKSNVSTQVTFGFMFDFDLRLISSQVLCNRAQFTNIFIIMDVSSLET